MLTTQEYFKFAQRSVEVNVQKIDERAIIPSYAHVGDACFDLHVLLDENNIPMIMDGKTPLMYKDGACTIPPRGSVVFHTGLKFATEGAYVLQVFPRSSTGIKKRLSLSNTVGIIDTLTYRGELLISMQNNSSEDVVVLDGDKIAQGMFLPIYNALFTEVDELDNTTRGEGGIGSSGDR